MNLAKQAMELAKENYETWGHWVVECLTLSELQVELEYCGSLEEWVEFRISVASTRKEIEDTAF